MALLTADDVLNKKFQATKFREGYDQDEVDDFLDEVVNTMRVLTAENDELKSKLAAAERRVAELSRDRDVEAPAVAAEPAGYPPAPVYQPGVSSYQQPQDATFEPVTPEPEPEAPAAPAPAPVASPAPSSEPESATTMLALAQKLHDDYVRSGREEGDRLVDEAKAQAQKIVAEAQDTANRTMAQLEEERSLLEHKIDELRVFERDYRSRLKSYLENLLADVDNRAVSLPPVGRGFGSDKDSARGL